jgi:hypothetical protein
MKNHFSFPCMFVFLCIYLAAVPAFSQIIKTESFDGIQYPPFGWTAGKINGSDPHNRTERATAGAPAPQSGAGMVRYTCGSMFNPGEQCFLASPAYDLTNNPGTATVSFWLYKDAINTMKDSVTLYINNAALLSANRVKVMGPISRDTTGFNGWKKYTAVIPPGFNNTQAYFIFVFTNRETSGAGPNLYIDNVQVQTFPKPAVLVSSTIHYQETSTIGVGLNDQLIIGIKITVSGAGGMGNDSLRLDSIVTNANGSTNILADIISPSAKCWYTKGTNSFITNGNQYGATLTPTYTRDKFAQANFFLENGENYFWITYSTRPAVIATGNCVDADFLGAYYRWPAYTGADTSRGPVLSTLSGCRWIDHGLCYNIIPAYNYGTSGNGNYTSNDFIQRVYVGGAHWYPGVNNSYPWIDNNVNTNGPFGAYTTPFTVHPPDYELFPESSSSPAQPHTTAVLGNGLSYPAPAIVAGSPTHTGGIALQVGTWPSSNFIAAWIDFNKDGDLLDPGEQIINSTGLNANQWVTGPIIVPSAIGSSTSNAGTAAPGPGIVYGKTTLRVREVFSQNPILPCQSGYNFGETEDYTVTIIPGCPAGIKLWLGYTDNWSDASNWCGGTPTIDDIVVIDEVNYLGGPGGAPFEPVIHSGTNATAKTIRISGTDTLTVNASSGSSLTIADSLNISYNGSGGKLLIKSAFSDTMQIANGAFSTAITPFMGNKHNGRMQLIYTKNDLTQHGLQAGDNIDQFLFHIRLRATPSPVASYAGFTIKYATVDSTWHGWPVGLPVSLAPNTSPYVTVFGPATVTLPMAAGTGGDLTLNLTNSMYWNGVSNLVLEICFDNSTAPNGSNVDQLYQTQVPTPGYNCTLWLNNNGGPSVPGCSLNWPVSGSTAVAAAQFRPNITFHFIRPYSKFPINIAGNGNTTAGHWINNGIFVAGKSNVTFSNSHLNQSIAGSSSTDFDQLTVNKNGTSVKKLTLYQYTQVESSLVLNGGILELNKNTLLINNAAGSGITRTAGGIMSETVNPPYGTVSWNIGTNQSVHHFPFITASSSYIPFNVTMNTGNAGVYSAATYPTSDKIKPYPVGVNNVNDSTGHNDSAYTVKRFWVLDKTGPGGNADLKFSYKNTEAPAPIVKSNLKANRYEYSTNLWQRFTLPVSTVVGSNVSSVTVSNVTGNPFTSAAWALSDGTHPLRIEGAEQPYADAYPNPFSESFIVSWDKDGIFDLLIYDMDGRKVYEKKVSSGERVTPGSLMRGAYIVELKSSDAIERFRMIKTE